MFERSPGQLSRLTLRQLDRLRYIAACGPVFRVYDDEDLERMQLVRPFNGMPSVVEATFDADRFDEPPVRTAQRPAGAAKMLLDACRATLDEFSQRDWCRQGYGCDRCEGCSRYRRLEATVANVEQDPDPNNAAPHAVVTCRAA